MSSIKKPLSAYQFFCSSSEIRSAIKAEEPTILPKQMMEKIGKKWKELSEDEKKPFVELATADKERYKNEMATAPPATEVAAPATAGGKKKKKSSSKKRGLTGYQLFSKDIRSSLREENPSLSLGEQSKIISTKWRELSSEEKEEYKSRAKTANEEANATEVKSDDSNTPVTEPATNDTEPTPVKEESTAKTHKKKGTKKF